ncbi:MAG: FG-GAP repeat domain-containing protein [bacterium]
MQYLGILRSISFYLVFVLVIIFSSTGMVSGPFAGEKNAIKHKGESSPNIATHRVAFGIGPTGGVEEKTENDLHNQALDHWEEVTKKKCVGVPAEDCEAIPEKVQNYYDKNPSDEPDKIPGTFDLVKLQEPMVDSSDGTGVRASGLSLADVDDDGDQDLGVIGGSESGNTFLLYENDGSGQFGVPSFTASPAPGKERADLEFGDIDGMSGSDMVVTGGFDASSAIFKTYSNDGMGNYTEFENPLGSDTGLGRFPAQKLADLNNDGHLDLVAQGVFNSSNFNSGVFIFHNDGSGSFDTAVQDAMKDNGEDTGLLWGDLAIADLNGDGYRDLVGSGYSIDAGFSTLERLIVFKNTGSGTFTKHDEPMKDLNDGTGVISGAKGLELADFNEDGHPDLLIVGEDSNTDTRLVIYENDGTGDFIEKILDYSDTYGGYAGDVTVADFNQNGSPDFAVTGRKSSSSDTGQLIVFTNNGTGSFDKRIEPFKKSEGDSNPGLSDGEIISGDVDGDGDPDLIVSGKDSNYDKRLVVYENQVFTE